MGDIADWYLDQMMGGDWGWYAPPRRRPTCNQCGKYPLMWAQDGPRWVLMEKGQPHRCPRTAEEEFG